ncbi:hypothetical protein BDZ94DRAFT_1137526, partial [Collybia nuda]
KTSSTSQFFPRQSQEARDHPERIQKLQELFKEVFQWQRSVIEKLLPEKCEILRQWVDRLPTNDFSPFYPFGGIVLNFNVTMRCHQDWKDQDLCMVIVISDCVGGDLGLVEPGITGDLRNGDMVTFTSS